MTIAAGLMEARPPYVTFELRAEEDRTASIAQGKYVARDIPFALITPQGSKDRLERNAEEWLTHISEEARNGRFPQEWADHYHKAFAAWQNGQDLPTLGSPIANWPVPTPAQVRMLLDINIRTVEELAQANEEALGHLGMGGRALKQRAIDFLAQSGDAGKAAAEMEVLRTAHAEVTKQNAEMKEQLAALTAQVAALAGTSTAKPSPKS